jgi:heme-degrading monooxygenase HmoA
MFSVIFEVHPKQEKFDLYLDLAKGLKPILEGIDGFIDNERFESTRRLGWILSQSTWRDEKSVVRWRTVGKHHDTHQRGRDEVFQDYHLRVGESVRDTAPPAGGAIDLVEDHINPGIRFVELPSSAVRNSEYAPTRASSENLLLRPLGLGRTQAIAPANPAACWPHSTSGWPIRIDKARFPRNAIERGA